MRLELKVLLDPLAPFSRRWIQPAVERSRHGHTSNPQKLFIRQTFCTCDAAPGPQNVLLFGTTPPLGGDHSRRRVLSRSRSALAPSRSDSICAVASRCGSDSPTRCAAGIAAPAQPWRAGAAGGHREASTAAWADGHPPAHSGRVAGTVRVLAGDQLVALPTVTDGGAWRQGRGAHGEMPLIWWQAQAVRSCQGLSGLCWSGRYNPDA